MTRGFEVRNQRLHAQGAESNIRVFYVSSPILTSQGGKADGPDEQLYMQQVALQDSNSELMEPESFYNGSNMPALCSGRRRC